MAGPKTISTLHPDYQEPVLDWLGTKVTAGLQGGLPQFPGFANLQDIYDPEVTQQYFQEAFVAPTMRRLTGLGGVIPRIGARAAQRGTYFSSGRQQNEAEAISGAFGSLAGTFADLQNQNLQAMYGEWQRTQPTGQIARQAVNFLGTPMTMTYEDQPNPWASVIGAGAGAGLGIGLGALLAAPTGGLSMGMGALLGGLAGSQAGAGIGNIFA